MRVRSVKECVGEGMTVNDWNKRKEREDVKRDVANGRVSSG